MSSPSKTLVAFGQSGQVAQELSRLGVQTLGREDVDFNDPRAVGVFVRSAQVDGFINAAAYTAVDKAETDEPAANLINHTSVAALAQCAAARGLPVVHISTDYVFDGTGDAPFATDHPVAPLGAYGRTKLAGEAAVTLANGPHATLRTSWVFSAHGGNFVKTMLRLGAERDALSIVADQIGGPTPAADIAATCVSIADQLVEDASKSGIYHFTGGPDVSWADFAREIFTQAGLDCAVSDIPSSDYPTPAQRPLNSRLDCSATQSVFGIARPDWRAGLKDVLKELV